VKEPWALGNKNPKDCKTRKIIGDKSILQLAIPIKTNALLDKIGFKTRFTQSEYKA